MALEFDEQTRLGILQERFNKLEAQQEEWLEIKAVAVQQSDNGTLTGSQKESIATILNTKHDMLVKEYVALGRAVDSLKTQANATGDAALEAAASELAGKIGESDLSEGLNAQLPVDLDNVTFDSEGPVTADEAKTRAEDKLGFEATSVTEEARGNVTYYVVKGNESSTDGSFETKKFYEAWVRADTGAIAAAYIAVSFQSEQIPAAEIQSNAKTANPNGTKLDGNESDSKPNGNEKGHAKPKGGYTILQPITYIKIYHEIGNIVQQVSGGNTYVSTESTANSNTESNANSSNGGSGQHGNGYGDGGEGTQGSSGYGNYTNGPTGGNGSTSADAYSNTTVISKAGDKGASTAESDSNTLAVGNSGNKGMSDAATESETDSYAEAGDKGESTATSDSETDSVSHSGEDGTSGSEAGSDTKSVAISGDNGSSSASASSSTTAIAVSGF
ncbi:MAG: hypothetical protein J4431_02510 [Candidatus Aenigmarchaeota archaeon]|nr:hypothetical protein [Candidatus Aenigmarchaeota archaeon]